MRRWLVIGGIAGLLCMILFVVIGLIERAMT
jgi:uncharacterized membrane protein